MVTLYCRATSVFGGLFTLDARGVGSLRRLVATALIMKVVLSFYMKK